MNKKLVINLITLVITTFLLIFVINAWYVTNEKANVSGIIGATDSDAFSLELERGEYNAGSQTKWTWTNTNNLAISNMQPGDAFFFRFKITASKAGSFKVTLSDIVSQLQEGVLDRTSVTVGNTTKYYVTMNSTKIYEMQSATLCSVYSDQAGNTKLGDLYSYNTTDSVLELEEFKVEDAFLYYDYGIGSDTFFNNQDNNVLNDGTVTSGASSIKSFTTTYTIQSVEESNVWYGYFALEFNDTASKRTYKHYDGTVKEDSNLFQAQILSIRQFGLEEI